MKTVKTRLPRSQLFTSNQEIIIKLIASALDLQVSRVNSKQELETFFLLPLAMADNVNYLLVISQPWRSTNIIQKYSQC